MPRHCCLQTPCPVCFPSLPVRMAVSHPDERWEDSDKSDLMVPKVLLDEQLAEIAQLRKDLQLALELLSSELNQEPCRLIKVGDVEVTTVRVWPDGTRQTLPPGACLSHPYESEQPCPIGEGQKLLEAYGLRPVMRRG